MRKFLIIAATAAGVAAFTPVPSYAQIAVDTPIGGVRIGEPPRHEERRDEFRERDVRARPDCVTKSVHESSPAGSETRSKTVCN